MSNNRRRSLLMPIFVLSVTACLCTGGAAGSDFDFEAFAEDFEEPSKSDQVATFIPEVTSALPPDAITEPDINDDASTLGMFSTVTLPPGDLPELEILATGLGPNFCSDAEREPSFTLSDMTSTFKSLCVYGFDVAIDATPIIFTLTSPTGQSYSETYTFANDDQGVLSMFSSSGEDSAYPSPDFEGTGEPPTSFVVQFNFNAGLPTGEWQLRVEDGSTQVEDDIIIEFFEPLTTVSDQQAASPFYTYDSYERPANVGTPLYLEGAGYPPNTELTLAVYWQPNPDTPAIYEPYLQTLVTSDSSGRFSVTYTPGTESPSSAYYALIFPQDTIEGFINPFAGRFEVAQ